MRSRALWPSHTGVAVAHGSVCGTLHIPLEQRLAFAPRTGSTSWAYALRCASSRVRGAFGTSLPRTVLGFSSKRKTQHVCKSSPLRVATLVRMCAFSRDITALTDGAFGGLAHRRAGSVGRSSIRRVPTFTRSDTRRRNPRIETHRRASNRSVSTSSRFALAGRYMSLSHDGFRSDTQHRRMRTTTKTQNGTGVVVRGNGSRDGRRAGVTSAAPAASTGGRHFGARRRRFRLRSRRVREAASHAVGSARLGPGLFD